MTMLSPRPSTVSTRPRSSTAAGPGGRSRLSSSRRWNGWTGSIIAGCWSPSATSRRPKPRNATMPSRSNPSWRRDSNETASGKPGAVHGCLVLDVRLPGTSGLELQAHLTGLNVGLPIILMTGFGDIPMSVKGMKVGAVDFLTKPVRDQDLLDAVAAAIQVDQSRRQEIAQIGKLREQYALLTPRERQVMALVASRLMNKHVANELSISEVSGKMHRSSAMRKLGAKPVARLARIAEILKIPS